MFFMFCLGMVIGAVWLGAILAFCSTKPDAFKIALFLMLFACLLSQWIIADRDNQALGQYQHLSGGKGDFFK